MQSRDWDPHKRLLTVEESAKSLERPPSTIRRWISEGLKVTARMNGRPLVLESDLMAWESAARRRATNRL